MNATELNDRKRAILSAIIRSYSQTGEPVGSKALCELLDLSLSSATLRNEMSDLCALGYLEQPHTSAGRIPTVLGYKLYIDDIMKRKTLSGENKLIIDTLLDGISGDVESIPFKAGQILSDLTGFPVLTSSTCDENDIIKKIELLPLGRRTILLVAVTENKIMKNSLCKCNETPSDTLIDRFHVLCDKYIIGKPISAFTQSYSQQLIASSGDISLLSLTAALFELIGQFKHSELNLRGESNLFRLYAAHGDIQRIMEIISQKDLVLSLLEQVHEPIGVLFGRDTEINEFNPATLVVAKYGRDGHEFGKIGILGPTHMAYEKVIPNLEYFARKLGDILSDTLN